MSDLGKGTGIRMCECKHLIIQHTPRLHEGYTGKCLFEGCSCQAFEDYKLKGTPMSERGFVE